MQKKSSKTPLRSKQKSKTEKSELLNLMNVGPAMLRDLHLLGIHQISALAKQNPEKMYKKLEKLTGHRQDPCVLDVFSAIVYEAKTGKKTPWWHWSAKRKQRERKNIK